MDEAPFSDLVSRNTEYINRIEMLINKLEILIEAMDRDRVLLATLYNENE